MPPLHPTHEAFAQALAAGSTARDAALAAGYSASTAEAKAHKIARRAEIMARVAVLKGVVPDPQPAPIPQPAQQAPAQPAPEPRAASAPHVLPIQYEPPRPLPRIDLARADRDAVKRWTLEVLHALAHESWNARDRRATASALAEVSKISGSYAPTRVDAVHVSVLDTMSREEMTTLLRVLDDPAALAAVAQQPAMIEGEAEEAPEGEEEVECVDPLS